MLSECPSSFSGEHTTFGATADVKITGYEKFYRYRTNREIYLIYIY